MPPGYYRFPTIHADQVIFVCEDDLWSVPAEGGIARRLTSNLGEVTRPYLSPDGDQLAFIGREEGQSEVYCMPATSGMAKRITFMGSSLCHTAGWTPAGEIIFASNAGHWYHEFSSLYIVDPCSLLVEQPRRLGFGLARSIAFGPTGSLVIGRNSEDPARWKRYRGGTSGRLWINHHPAALSGEGVFEPLIELHGNLTSPMWMQDGSGSPGRIYFLSDHEGTGNLYSCLPDGQDLRRHTDHEDFYARNASTDGYRIVYHAGADLFLFDPAAEKNRQIPVQFYSPQTQRNRKFVPANHYLESWKLHPSGQAVTISARGKIFAFANWEGGVLSVSERESQAVASGKQQPGGENLEPILESIQLKRAARPSIRYRLPRWLNDGERVIAVTDDGGEESFIILNVLGNAPPLSFPDLDIGRPEDIAVCPEYDRIVFSNNRYELQCLDLDSGKLSLIDRGLAHPISGFNWSPDGEWIAYSVSISLQITALKLWNATTGEIHSLTQPVLRDVVPAFDPHGRYLYFISFRNFDPVQDNLQFDLNFLRGMRPYLITLRKDLPSPFVPKPRLDSPKREGKEMGGQSIEPGETSGETKPSSDDAGSSENGSAVQTANPEDQKKAATDKLHIDLDGIESRIVAFPVTAGRYGRILGTREGKVLYSCYPVHGALESDDGSPDGALLIYHFDEQREDTIAYQISDFDLSPDGAWLIYRSGSRIRVLKAGDKPDDRGNDGPNRTNGWLDLGRVHLPVLPGEEWKQMFREAWRLQRDQFWTPDMSQIDWLRVHDRYLPLVDRISSRSEFSDLMGEMQGELGTSHTYEIGGDYRRGPNYGQGFLGATCHYDPESGAWRIAEILKGDPWDPKASSPLDAPGLEIHVGDRLLAINGRRLGENLSPQAALVNLAGQEVYLTIDGENGLPRQVIVKTLTSETSTRYRQWVEANRKRVHEATGGRVGYLHIPDMGPRGYAEFHRGYLAEVDRLGLIVDVRFNSGGSVSSLLLEKLARRRLGYDIVRWHQIPIPYPRESVAGPLVAITNEFAGSDGDIFSHSFKLMKLGPLIGKRTWGGVIGIEPRHSLVDGTVTTQPEFSFWFLDVGWNIENFGTVPDIEVDLTPQDYQRGYDAQLERGIQEILGILEKFPPELPQFDDRPNRSAPRLPKRLA